MKFKERHRGEPPSLERDDVRVAGNRCPFCHEDVELEPFDWVSCGSCQARHHDACWEEGGACGSCGNLTRLIPEASGLGESAAEDEALNPMRTVGGVLASVALGAVFVVGNSYSTAGERFLWWLGVFWLSAPLLVLLQWAIRKTMAAGK